MQCVRQPGEISAKALRCFLVTRGDLVALGRDAIAFFLHLLHTVLGSIAFLSQGGDLLMQLLQLPTEHGRFLFLHLVNGFELLELASALLGLRFCFLEPFLSFSNIGLVFLFPFPDECLPLFLPLGLSLAKGLGYLLVSPSRLGQRMFELTNLKAKLRGHCPGSFQFPRQPVLLCT